VNETCARHLDWAGEELPYVMHVSTPLGKTVVASKCVSNRKIQVGKEALKAILIVIPIEDYDLILGIEGY
jgi:hypothetical protein